MAFSEGTMERMNAALRALQDAASGVSEAFTTLAESQDVSKRFPGFTCNIRITCGWCGHTVCANEEHPEYEPDPFDAMHEHKIAVHKIQLR